jgi:tetratricopeptide (TPR) repeat protein
MEKPMAAAAADPLVLARHYLRLDQFERVLEALDNVTAAELDDAEVWRIRAGALHGLRRHAEAVEAAKNGLARRPDDVVLLDQLALSAFESGKRGNAHEALARALELAPDEALLHAHRAIFLARTTQRFRIGRKRLKEATASAELAASLAPESLQVLRIRALVASLAGDRRAQAYEQELLALDPDDKDSRLVSGTVSARSRDIGAALGHYVEAARIDPSDRRTAWLGRRSRTLMHPAAAPLRLIWRAGARRVHLAVVVLSFALLALHAPTARAILGACWLVLVAYSVVIRVGLRVRFGRRPR